MTEHMCRMLEQTLDGPGFPSPDQVDAETIEAKLAEGVLTMRVPESERAQRRKV